VSTFFCLAIIIKLLSDNRPRHHYFLKAIFLMLGMTIGYYFRPTLLYLSPLVVLLYGLSLWRPQAHLENMKRFKQPRGFAIIMMMRFIPLQVWKQLRILPQP
jgi:hypothetical protein